jgi:hypothetical protein
MAVISVNQYNDDGTTARTAGELLTISGAVFTQRTDTRWGSGLPISGSYSSIIINANVGGQYIIDATKVRWLPFSGGSGVCAIGSPVVQGTSSGYFLGAYSSLASAPSTTIPTSGYLKIREMYAGTISGGAFTLSGIPMTASGPLQTGWLEIVQDALATTSITVPRLGKFQTRGDWFYLDNTNGLPGQLIQVPTNGGGANTQSPGIWIETGQNSGTYEYYPALSGLANGWAQYHISSPGLSGINQDSRQKFVKVMPTGILQLGESYTSSPLVYTTAQQSGTYTWSADTVTATFTAHGLRVGEKVYLDFTSGGATANDGIYTIITNAANTFTVTLSGAGTAGNVTIWGKSNISVTAHGYAVGNLLHLDFSTGGIAATGVYMIETVPNANNFTVNTYSPSNVSGNVTIRQTIGYVPPSGCRTRVPNIFLRQCATASRTSNSAPNATIATRPEFLTTSAGAIDSEYCYGDWYYNFSQPYSVRLINSATWDAAIISECASALDVSGFNISMYAALDTPTLTLTSNFAGGTVADGKFHRGNAPGTSDHAITISNCNDITFNNVDAGIIQFARNTGYSFNVATCKGLTFNNCRSINSTTFSLATSSYITSNNIDWCDRFMGYTNSTASSYVFTIPAGCSDININGITFGYAGQVINNHPYAGIISVTAATNVKLRNMGTRSNMLSGGTIPLYSCGSAVVSGGNSLNIKMQRIYIATETLRAALFTENNSDTVNLKESLYSFKYKTTAGVVTDNTLTPVVLNGYHKGIGHSLNTTTGQTSVYNTHWADMFTSDTVGRVIACMNEPTTAAQQVLNVLSLSGSAGGFTSAGSLALPTSGDIYTTECDYYIKGHTGLTSTTPVVTGTNVTYSAGSMWGNHSIKYQIDTSGTWNGTWKDFTAANLSGEPISPTGFKLKYQIQTMTTSTANLLTYIRVETSSTLSGQANNLYDLDTNTITLTGLKSGSEVRAYLGTDPTTATVVGGIESSSTEYTISHSATGPGYIQIFALGWLPIHLDWTYSAEDKEIPVQQVIDRQYLNP